MIKRTLYFGNPAYLKLSNAQIEVQIPVSNKDQIKKEWRTTTIPIEDVGMVVLDHQQITITQALLAQLMHNNTAVLTCNSSHHPAGLFLNMEGNTLQAKRFRKQSEMSLPLKKQLWAQTIQQKIYNQAAVLEKVNPPTCNFLYLNSDRVTSGDINNLEGQSAAYYWSHVFGSDSQFTRKPEGANPNLLLNYGYAIIRAAMARAIVGTGLHCTLGIHHRNQYNAFCLADDLMEPYRPYVDLLVIDIMNNNEMYADISKDNKAKLLSLLTLDTYIGKEKSPLQLALSKTSASLWQCIEGKRKKLILPKLKIK